MESYPKNREFNNNGNHNGNTRGNERVGKQRYDDRPRSPMPYRQEQRPPVATVSTNGNQASGQSSNPYIPPVKKQPQQAPKGKGSIKEEVLDLVDSGELSVDAKVISLALLNLANKVEHQARVFEEFAKKLEDEKNEKGQQETQRQ